MKLDAKSTIETGKAILGIELGSTRNQSSSDRPEKQAYCPRQPHLGKSVSRRALDVQY